MQHIVQIHHRQIFQLMEKLIAEFADLEIDTAAQDLCAMIRRVSTKWTKESRVTYNRCQVKCACGKSTRRNNLKTHQKTTRCKKWHRRQRALKKKLKVKIEPCKKRKLKSKRRTVWL